MAFLKHWQLPIDSVQYETLFYDDQAVFLTNSSNIRSGI